MQSIEFNSYLANRQINHSINQNVNNVYQTTLSALDRLKARRLSIENRNKDSQVDDTRPSARSYIVKPTHGYSNSISTPMYKQSIKTYDDKALAYKSVNTSPLENSLRNDVKNDTRLNAVTRVLLKMRKEDKKEKKKSQKRMVNKNKKINRLENEIYRLNQIIEDDTLKEREEVEKIKDVIIAKGRFWLRCFFRYLEN